MIEKYGSFSYIAYSGNLSKDFTSVDVLEFFCQQGSSTSSSAKCVIPVISFGGMKKGQFQMTNLPTRQTGHHLGHRLC